MKKTLSLILAIPLYLVSAGAAAAYVITEVEDRLMLRPFAKTLLVCAFALFLFLGSRLISANAFPHRKGLIMKATFWGVFVAYLILLVSFTFFDAYFGRADFRFIFTAPDEVTGIYTKTSINLIPFKNIGNFTRQFLKGNLSPEFFLTNVGGNLLAFMPMAFFIPLLTKRYSRFLPFALFTGLCIIAVEGMQIILLTGFCDIDDLILNLGGACVAYAILRIPFISRLVSRITGLEYPNKNALK